MADATNEMQFFPYAELEPEIQALVDSEEMYDRIMCVEHGFGLDKLLSDEEASVRKTVAEKGYGLDVLMRDLDASIRKIVAEHGYGLDELVYDSDEDVRAAVAEQKYALDILIQDSSSTVRSAVAKQKYGLNTLIQDSSRDVKRAVAEQGYGLDILMQDDDEYVRAVVARQGHGLDTLISDESSFVRQAVAEQGYGLDTLMFDKFTGVRYTAAEVLANMPVNDIFDWIKKYPDRRGPEVLGVPYEMLSDQQRIMVDSSDDRMRVEAAKHGFGLDVLVNDESEDVRANVACLGYGLDLLLDDSSVAVRNAVYEQMNGWRTFGVNIGDWMTLFPNRCGLSESEQQQVMRDCRAALELPFVPYEALTTGHRALVDSEYFQDRFYAAEQHYGFDKLVDDSDSDIRCLIADQGCCLEILVDDPNYRVRERVAENGYGLDKLIDDDASSVRYVAGEVLAHSPYNDISDWIAANRDKCALSKNRVSTLLTQNVIDAGIARLGGDELIEAEQQAMDAEAALDAEHV